MNKTNEMYDPVLEILEGDLANFNFQDLIETELDFLINIINCSIAFHGIKTKEIEEGIGASRQMINRVLSKRFHEVKDKNKYKILLSLIVFAKTRGFLAYFVKEFSSEEKMRKIFKISNRIYEYKDHLDRKLDFSSNNGE